MAATREAIALCIDVGMGMLEEQPSSNQEPPVTCFKQAISLASMMLERKIFCDSKDEVAVVLFGCDETSNDLAADGQYQNIKVLSRLQLATFRAVEALHQLAPSLASSGDLLDALIVCLDLLRSSRAGKKFACQRIFMLSNVAGQFSDDQLDLVTQALKDEQTELALIGPLSDPDPQQPSNGDGPSTSTQGNGAPRNKLKSPTQLRAESVVRSMLQSGVEGSIYSFGEVHEVLVFFNAREMKATSWSVNMELGSLQIPVLRFIATKEHKLKSWTKINADTRDESQVKLTRSFYTQPADATEEEKEVDVEDLAKGYRYGTSLIPFSDADEANIKLENNKCLKILGFPRREQVRLQEAVGESSTVIVAPTTDQGACVALSSLIQACVRQGRVALARYAYSKASNPRLVALIPVSKPTHECFVSVQLPFADDIRTFPLPSLDQYSKLQPSQQQQAAMLRLVQSTDLDAEHVADLKLYKPSHTFNPLIQRTYQCLAFKRFHPDEDLPEVDPNLTRCLNPEEIVVTGARASIDEVKSSFPTKVVEKSKPTAGNRIFDSKTPQNDVSLNGDVSAAKIPKLSDLSDISSNRIQDISSIDPVGDFLNMVSNCGTDFSEPCRRMSEKIVELVINSFSGELDAKVRECITEFRAQSLRLNFVQRYNAFYREFLELLISRKNDSLLKQLRTIGHVTAKEHADGMAEEESQSLEETLHNSVSPTKPAAPYDDTDDLLAELD